MADTPFTLEELPPPGVVTDEYPANFVPLVGDEEDAPPQSHFIELLEEAKAAEAEAEIEALEAEAVEEYEGSNGFVRALQPVIETLQNMDLEAVVDGVFQQADGLLTDPLLHAIIQGQGGTENVIEPTPMVEEDSGCDAIEE